MENQLQVSENKEFGTIRVIERNGQPFLYDILKGYGIRSCAERPGGALIGGDGDLRS